MDAKITRKRLSDYLAYQWIAIIIAIVVGIILLEAVFAIAAVKPTAGQTFNIYYYKGVKPDTNLAVEIQKDTFSYDFIGGVESEDANYTDEVLFAKIDAFMADVIITSTDYTAKIVDNRKVCDLETLYSSAKAYVDYFYDGETINAERVEQKFLERLSKDNRFRTDEQKKTGIAQETQRIEKLKADVTAFGEYLSQGRESTFYRYTRFKNVYENGNEEYKEQYREYYEAEVAAGRVDLIYGMKVSSLSDGEHDPTEYFKLEDGTEEGTEAVILLLDQREINGKENPLFYEGVSFFCKVLRLCSDYIA